MPGLVGAGGNGPKWQRPGRGAFRATGQARGRHRLDPRPPDQRLAVGCRHRHRRGHSRLWLSHHRRRDQQHARPVHHQRPALPVPRRAWLRCPGRLHRSHHGADRRLRDAGHAVQPGLYRRIRPARPGPGRARRVRAGHRLGDLWQQRHARHHQYRDPQGWRLQHRAALRRSRQPRYLSPARHLRQAFRQRRRPAAVCLGAGCAGAESLLPGLRHAGQQSRLGKRHRRRAQPALLRQVFL